MHIHAYTRKYTSRKTSPGIQCITWSIAKGRVRFPRPVPPPVSITHDTPLIAYAHDPTTSARWRRAIRNPALAAPLSFLSLLDRAHEAAPGTLLAKNRPVAAAPEQPNRPLGAPEHTFLFIL